MWTDVSRCMERGAGGGWRNSVGSDVGPDRSGETELSSMGVVVEQAAVGEPWVVWRCVRRLWVQAVGEEACFHYISSILWATG